MKLSENDFRICSKIQANRRTIITIKTKTVMKAKIDSDFPLRLVSSLRYDMAMYENLTAAAMAMK
jgi:hypothetical protein